MTDSTDNNNNETVKAEKKNVDGVFPVLIQDEMKSCYIDYAMSVIIGRALPDVRDGLKPVHRRVLYAMHDLGNYHNKPFLKSARVVGDVIGKYHPHGDSAVYNTIVRMAQDFSLRYPLVDGQGNFGSIDGDSAAAMRYTEIRMQKMAEEMLADLEKETVDWQPNYDDSRKEPAVLPAKIPNLLINGSTGIAVGMATNIPPHNLKEITQGLIALLDDNNTSIEQLIKIIPGPDFPTAGAIHGVEGIRSAYRTGRGVIQIRSKYEIEEIGKTDRQRIVITELPYQVIKAKLIERIAELVNEKTIEGISGIRDESNRLGIRVCIDLKKGEIPAVVVNRLFKHTQMQESFGIIFLAIHNGAPKVMNLKEILSSFLEHRREIIIRRTIFDLNKAKAKAHILEGLKIAVENIDPIIRLIKSAEGPTEARDQLMSQYKLSEKQAQAILEMRLQRLTGLERDRIVKDYEDTLREIEGLERLLASEELIKQEMKREFQEILEKHGDERRTEIVGQVDDIDIVDMIKQEDVIVTTTHKGYIKRMAIDTYKTQKRGGVGVKGADALEDDFYNKIFIADTHAIILFFTNRGMVFAKHVYNIPEAVRTAKGRNIANLIPIPSDEKIMEVLCLPAEIENKFLMFATAKGVVKKSELSEYTNIKQNGIRALKLQDGDYIVSVRVTDGLKDVLLCSTAGKIIRFPETDCRPLGRVSQGVKGISIEEDEKIIGMEIIDDNVEILSITENGYGKRTVSADYRKQSRGGKGIIAMKLTEKNGDIIDIKPVTDKDDLMIITDKGQVVRTSIAGISLMGRTTQGVRIIKVKEGEKVVAVEKIAEAEHNENNDTAAENTNKKEDGSNNKVDE